MSKKLIVANWKENPKTAARALKLFSESAKIKKKGVETVICPPFIYLEDIAKKSKKNKNVALGAQDVFWEEKGAYTSEVGPRMLRSLGVRYALVGHSERRMYMKETDAMINRKIKRAVADGLKVILCVGEPASIRRHGSSASKKYIKNQLTIDLHDVRGGHIIVAYEPIWAIGTGKTDSPEDAREIASFIKKGTRMKVLYGGSVHGKNAKKLLSLKEIDGALVGGASLNAGEFKKIINASTNG